MHTNSATSDSFWQLQVIWRHILSFASRLGAKMSSDLEPESQITINNVLHALQLAGNICFKTRGTFTNTCVGLAIDDFVNIFADNTNVETETTLRTDLSVHTIRGIISAIYYVSIKSEQDNVHPCAAVRFDSIIIEDELRMKICIFLGDRKSKQITLYTIIADELKHDSNIVVITGITKKDNCAAGHLFTKPKHDNVVQLYPNPGNSCDFCETPSHTKNPIIWWD